MSQDIGTAKPGTLRSRAPRTTNLLAGLAVQQIGWRTLNIAMLPLLAILILAAGRLRSAASTKGVATV